jgi:hypothetical protein
MTDELRDKLINQLPSMKGKNGRLHPTSKKVIDTKTGRVFDTVSEAAAAFNLKQSPLSKRLGGRYKNNTTLRYYEN